MTRFSRDKKLRVLFLLRRTGPYHHARFVALAERVVLTTAETRPDSAEYPWEFRAGGTYEKFRFPTVDAEAGLSGEKLRTVIKKLFDDHNPDVLITTGWADREYHVAVTESAARRIPAVVISDSRFEDEPRHWMKELVKRMLLKSYAAALVAGSMSFDYLTRLGFSAARIYKPWDVVDNAHFANADAPVAFDERYFLCISRFIPKKNIPRLLDAFASYRTRGGKRTLVLAGSGQDSDSLQTQIAQLGLTAFVHLPGFVQYEGLPALMAGAICLVLPSTTDQWGLVVNEAMAAGLPVLVSSQCGCAPDLVIRGVNGDTFDPFNTKELAGLLDTIGATTEDSWRRMGAEARKTIRSWDAGAFATAAENACQHAAEHPTFGNFGVIHTLLSR